MESFNKEYTFKIGKCSETALKRSAGIAQDGTTPMCRDKDGKLWAMSGHSHIGHIGIFCGTKIDDLEEVWQANTNFCVGHADFAFSGIRYPDGTKARGSVWPFGADLISLFKSVSVVAFKVLRSVLAIVLPVTKS